MSIALDTADRARTAAAFLATDQHAFGDGWRYAPVEGRIVAHAAPAPDHSAILAGLAASVANRLRGSPGGCRPESGSGAVPKDRQSATARMPDLMIRCADHPVVLFEVVSPSELEHWRDCDARRGDLQAVAGLQAIVELYQSEMACHVYRRHPDGVWSFDAVDGNCSLLHLPGVGLTIPLGKIDEFVTPSGRGKATSDEHHPQPGEPPC
jgi:hypothetical protein